MIRCAALCSRAQFKNDQENVLIEKRIVIGDASEAAILKFLTVLNVDSVKMRELNPKIFQKPFNSETKLQVMT